MIQFCVKDSRRIFLFLKTLPSSSYFTFAKGGYIMTISPIAIGMFVVPTWKKLITLLTPGAAHPSITPINMAKNIHSVR